MYFGLMMKALGITLLMFVVGRSLGQNLVPNPDFEAYSTCPTALYQLDSADGWSRSRGSPDYFNACDTTGVVGVPWSGMGYQNSFSGIGHAGIITYSDPDICQRCREFFGIELAAPMQAGLPYFLSFRTTPALWGTPWSMRFASNGIGLAFSTSLLQQSFFGPLTIEPALTCSVQLVDTASWILVEGCFVPDSAYTHLLVGSFLEDSLLTVALVDSSGDQQFAYAYVDDIQVILDSIACPLAMTDHGMPDLDLDENGSLILSGFPSTSLLLFRLFSMDGRLVSGWQLTTEQARGMQVPIQSLPSGLYLLEVTDDRSSGSLRILR